MFTNEGLAVKIMADYDSYTKYFKNNIKKLEDNNKVL